MWESIEPGSRPPLEIDDGRLWTREPEDVPRCANGYDPVIRNRHSLKDRHRIVDRVDGSVGQDQVYLCHELAFARAGATSIARSWG